MSVEALLDAEAGSFLAAAANASARAYKVAFPQGLRGQITLAGGQVNTTGPVKVVGHAGWRCRGRCGHLYIIGAIAGTPINVEIKKLAFVECRTAGNGLAIRCSENVVLEQCCFFGHEAGGDGGAIHATGGEPGDSQTGYSRPCGRA